MNLFKWIVQKFSTVYCEDCINCIPSDGQIMMDDGPMCKAYPIKVDCSDIDTYVDKNRKIKIVESYKRCKNLRNIKSLPLTYSSICFKFSPKSEKVLDM